MALCVSVCINGINVMYRISLGDLVLTYDGQLDQVSGINITTSEVKLFSGYRADPYELVPVRRIGSQALEVMKNRGKSVI